MPTTDCTVHASTATGPGKGGALSDLLFTARGSPDDPFRLERLTNEIREANEQLILAVLRTFGNVPRATEDQAVRKQNDTIAFVGEIRQVTQRLSRAVAHARTLLSRTERREWTAGGARSRVFTVPVRSADDAGAIVHPLTGRECEVLQLLAVGRSNREVGTELRISAKTVETHRARIMKKLCVHSVSGLVRYAIRKGMIEV
jgi:DNA-binding CsgD family transcriptional regulator